MNVATAWLKLARAGAVAASSDHPALGGVYKLVAVRENGVWKFDRFLLPQEIDALQQSNEEKAQ